MVADGEPRFWSVEEVAGVLRMSAMSVYRAIHAGEIPATKVRGKWLIPTSALDRVELDAVQRWEQRQEQREATAGG